MECLIYPFKGIEIFIVYISLGWHSRYIIVYRTSSQGLLAFAISIEKLGVILICLPLYVSWFYFPCIIFGQVVCLFGWFLDFETGFLFVAQAGLKLPEITVSLPS